MKKPWVALIVLVVVVAVVSAMLAGCGGKKRTQVAAAGANGMANNGEDDSNEGSGLPTYRHDGVAYKQWPEDKDKWTDGQRGEFALVDVGLYDVTNEGSSPAKIDLLVICREENNKLPVLFTAINAMAGPNDLTLVPGANTPMRLLPQPDDGLPVKELLLPGQNIGDGIYSAEMKAKSWEYHHTPGPRLTGTYSYETRDVTWVPTSNQDSRYYVQIPKDAKSGETYSFRLTLKSKDPQWEYTFPYVCKIYVR
jgi:hypothetical protein